MLIIHCCFFAVHEICHFCCCQLAPSHATLLNDSCSPHAVRLLQGWSSNIILIFFLGLWCILFVLRQKVPSRKFYWTSYPHDCKAELDIDEAMTFPSSAPGGWHFWFLMACLHCCYMDGHVAQPTLFTYLVTRLNCHRCLACVVLNSEGLHRKRFYRITIGLLLKAWKHSARKNRTGFWTQR